MHGERRDLPPSRALSAIPPVPERDEIAALLQGMAMVDERLSVTSLGEVPDVEIMMEQVDKDGSGGVGFDEFFVWYQEQAAKLEQGDETSLLFRLTRSME